MKLRIQGGLRDALAALLCVSAAVVAPARAQKTALEEFEPVDPYTKGERAALERAGYVSFGPFQMCEKHTSAEMSTTLGDIGIIFIETAHFRLASTLESYRPIGDQVERDALEREFAELKKKLPKFKVPAKIDPWLRAHLYAQRLEALYADFQRRFGLTDAEFAGLETRPAEARFMGLGPYLGQKDKFIVFLAQSRSALGRYLRTYVNVDNEYSYRAKYPDCYFFGANAESLKDNGRELDIALHTALAGALAQNFLDAFRESNQAAPEWFRYGLAHWYGRRVDARWNQWNAGGESNPDEDKNWIWEPRVLGLVKNEACPSWDDMTGWASYDDIKPRDHMVCWSRADWILEQHKEVARAFLFAVTDQVPPSPGEERSAAIRTQELRAYQTIWKFTPAQVEQAWRTWVQKQYPKREAGR